MVEEQFLDRDTGIDWKSTHGNENPARPAKALGLLQEPSQPNGEPKRKSEHTDEDERVFYEKVRQVYNLGGPYEEHLGHLETELSAHPCGNDALLREL
eukprot:11034207-Alexandrium_andersonii.AAC.1